MSNQPLLKLPATNRLQFPTQGYCSYMPLTRPLLHRYPMRTVGKEFQATNGKQLWTHNNGMGHNGGIITYTAKGKQYVAVMTGWGSLVGDGYGEWYSDVFLGGHAYGGDTLDI